MAIEESVRRLSNPVKEVVFENNPYLVQQIDKLLEEKKSLDKELDRTKLDVRDREDEVARLRGLIDKLRTAAENYKPDLGLEILPDKQNLKSHYSLLRTELVDRTLDYRNKIYSKTVKELCLRVFQLNKDALKMKRDYERRNAESVAQMQTTEITDPIFIWSQLRLRIVSWLFEIYLRSKNASTKHKQYAYVSNSGVPS
jgi:chromosome segregation ATPase